jgi:putative transposase
MQIEPDKLYHVFNQGNYQQPIFFSDADYLHFLNQARKNILPVADVLCYCLMPNHFHFLIQPNSKGAEQIKVGGIFMPGAINAFRLLQSGYTSYINNKQNKKGSLFRQKCKFKILVQPGLTTKESDRVYPLTCFHYIHQNPMKAGLVIKMEDWNFSSFRDYAGLRNGSFTNKDLAKQLLEINPTKFYTESYEAIGEYVEINLEKH